ncbi:MAG: Crp/Fnr family transcriptional regulator [Bacteroidota bacterium]
MKALRHAMRQMIPISAEEMDQFLAGCMVRSYERRENLSVPGQVANEVYFIQKGIIRVVTTDRNGTEHTLHFGLEHQFITDYASFLQNTRSIYTLQALEPTEVVVLPRDMVEWGYRNLQHGDRMGRLIAEFYFIYHDNRIKNLFAKTPKERYDGITEVFPDIHNRVPQHMIASYLGVTPVHLSRLKKQEAKA